MEAGVPMEIRSGYLPNIDLQRYHSTSQPDDRSVEKLAVKQKDQLFFVNCFTTLSMLRLFRVSQKERTIF
jgi:hypothetical protein